MLQVTVSGQSVRKGDDAVVFKALVLGGRAKLACVIKQVQNSVEPLL